MLHKIIRDEFLKDKKAKYNVRKRQSGSQLERLTDKTKESGKKDSQYARRGLTIPQDSNK